MAPPSTTKSNAATTAADKKLIPRKRPASETTEAAGGGATTTTTTTKHKSLVAAAAAAIKPPPAKRSETLSSTTSSSSSKAYKGLRHFSMMVCKKVEEKGTTTYNEVADELVQKVIEERRKEDPHGKFDEKNIRRRVYDALNVLMAMDIITKDKKAITWKGLPTSASQDLEMLNRELEHRRYQIERKRHALQELLIQQVCFRNLVEHNRKQELKRQHQADAEKIPLPFIVVNTHSSAVIQCNMSRDLTDVMFDFSMPFEINDDNTILKRLGMHKTTMSVLREMLPPDMLQYCQEHDLLDPILENKATGVVAPAAASSNAASATKK